MITEKDLIGQLKGFPIQVVEKMLERQKWCGDFFQYMEGNIFVCTGSDWTYCILYNDDTKHLVGTSMPAPEYYQE